MIGFKNKEVLKETYHIKNNIKIKEALKISAWILDGVFILSLILIVALKNVYIGIASILSLSLAILFMKISTEIKTSYIYELYSNTIRVIKKKQYNADIIYQSTLPECRVKTYYYSIEEAKKSMSKKDTVAMVIPTENIILSFQRKGSNDKFFISPSNKFLVRMQDETNDIS